MQMSASDSLVPNIIRTAVDNRYKEFAEIKVNVKESEFYNITYQSWYDFYKTYQEVDDKIYRRELFYDNYLSIYKSKIDRIPQIMDSLGFKPNIQKSVLSDTTNTLFWVYCCMDKPYEFLTWEIYADFKKDEFTSKKYPLETKYLRRFIKNTFTEYRSTFRFVEASSTRY